MTSKHHLSEQFCSCNHLLDTKGLEEQANNVYTSCVHHIIGDFNQAHLTGHLIVYEQDEK